MKILEWVFQENRGQVCKVWQAINIDLCLPALTVGSVVSTYCIMADNKASHTMSAAAYLTVHSNRIPSLQFGLCLFSFSVSDPKECQSVEMFTTQCATSCCFTGEVVSHHYPLFRCRELLYSRLSQKYSTYTPHTCPRTWEYSLKGVWELLKNGMSYFHMFIEDFLCNIQYLTSTTIHLWPSTNNLVWTQ